MQLFNKGLSLSYIFGVPEPSTVPANLCSEGRRTGKEEETERHCINACIVNSVKQDKHTKILLGYINKLLPKQHRKPASLLELTEETSATLSRKEPTSQNLGPASQLTVAE